MMRSAFRGLLAAAAAALGIGAGSAQAACTLPHNLTNGQPADASQVMANFNALATCVDNAAAAVRELLVRFQTTAHREKFHLHRYGVVGYPHRHEHGGIGLVYSVAPSSSTSIFPGAYRTVPVGAPWTLTARVRYPTLMRQPSGLRSLHQGHVRQDARTGYRVANQPDVADPEAQQLETPTFSRIPTCRLPYDAPTWLRINYDGTNLKFYASWDGQNWLYY